jgi:hypothetical protein
MLFRTDESQPRSLFTVSVVFHFQFSEHFLGLCIVRHGAIENADLVASL